MKYRPIQITLSQAAQVAVCTRCALPECRDGSRACPLMTEQRRIWKAWNQTRHAYWKVYDDARKGRYVKKGRQAKRPYYGGSRKPSYTTLKAREEVNLNGIEKDGKQP